MDYKQKYLKYKAKYIELKKQLKGGYHPNYYISELHKYINKHPKVITAIKYLEELQILLKKMNDTGAYNDYRKLSDEENKKLVEIKNFIENDISTIQPDY